MKKIFSVTFILASSFILAKYVYSNPTGPCPTGTGTQQCNGICVPIYAENGSVHHYECKKPDPGSSATKDCYESSIGGNGGE